MFLHGSEAAMHMHTHMLSTLFGHILLGTLIVTAIRWHSRKHAIPFSVCHKGGFFQHRPPHMSDTSSAMEILQQRYVRDEIDATTFDHMRERIEASEHPR